MGRFFAEARSGCDISSVWPGFGCFRVRRSGVFIKRQRDAGDGTAGVLSSHQACTPPPAPPRLSATPQAAWATVWLPTVPAPPGTTAGPHRRPSGPREAPGPRCESATPGSPKTVNPRSFPPGGFRRPELPSRPRIPERPAAADEWGDREAEHLQTPRTVRHIGVVAMHSKAKTLPAGVVAAHKPRLGRIAHVDHLQAPHPSAT